MALIYTCIYIYAWTYSHISPPLAITCYRMGSLCDQFRSRAINSKDWIIIMLDYILEMNMNTLDDLHLALVEGIDIDIYASTYLHHISPPLAITCYRMGSLSDQFRSRAINSKDWIIILDYILEMNKNTLDDLHFCFSWSH